MSPKTVKEKNDEKVKIIADVLKEPFKSGVECAFRGMARGEGIILDDDKLKTFENELDLVVRDADKEANKRALQQMFGHDTSFKSIMDYKQTTIPKKSPDFDEKVVKIKENTNQFIQSATIETRRKNDRHELKKDQKVRLPESNDHFQNSVKRIARDMAMKKVLGQDTPYKNYHEFVIQNNPSSSWEASEKLAPSDWNQKFDEFNTLQRQVKQTVIKETVEQNSVIDDKAMCLLVASQYHHETSGSIFTFKYDEKITGQKGIIGDSLKYPELGNAVKDAVNHQYPVFDVIPMSDYQEGMRGLLMLPQSRSQKIKENRNKAKYFTEEAKQKGFEKIKGTINGNRLPFGWYEIYSDNNEVIISQPIIAGNTKGFLRPEKIREWEQEGKPIPAPTVHLKKDDNGWIMEGYLFTSKGRVTKKKYATKDEAKLDLLCFVDSYEDTFDQFESKLMQKSGNISDDQKEHIKAEFEENVREKINLCRAKKNLM